MGSLAQYSASGSPMADTQHHSEAQLEVSGDAAHELIRKLLDGAPDAMTVVDGDGRIVLVNLQLEQLFCYTREQLLGRDVELLIPERFRGTHVAHRANFARAPRVRPMGTGRELFGRRSDGSEFPVEISLSPINTAPGLLIAASIRDISDRKRQEQEIRRIQEHLLNAVESIQGAFAIFDARDRLVLCNSSFRALLGSGVPGRMEDQTCFELFERSAAQGIFSSQADAGLRSEFLQRFRNYHLAPEGALDAQTRDGRSLRIVERPTTGGGRVTTIWDITADVVHEEQLRGARALAEAASSAKSEFLASMSHELRTPLNAILGFAQLLQRDKKTPLSDRQQERIGHVLSSGEHLLRLIDEVLDLSSIESGRVSVSIEEVQLPEILSEVKATLDPSATRNGIDVSIRPLPAALPAVLADRTRLKQILMNYGSNAIKYGVRGGQVNIEARVLADSVRVEVQDNGIGIPANKHDKVFQPFQRAGQETGPIQGTGIGLAITKRLAELMRGSVGFRSEPGQGSVFWIELHAQHAQRALSEQAKLADTASSLDGVDGPRFLVVYIEDNPSNIAFMEDFMGDYERIELITAPTAEIGVELVRAKRPNVVIMDLNLPGMGGLEATRNLREWPETKNIPVIGLSAAAMTRDVAKVSSAGFYRYLTKPVQVDELAQTLEELLGKA